MKKNTNWTQDVRTITFRKTEHYWNSYKIEIHINGLKLAKF